MQKCDGKIEFASGQIDEERQHVSSIWATTSHPRTRLSHSLMSHCKHMTSR